MLEHVILIAQRWWLIIISHLYQFLITVSDNTTEIRILSKSYKEVLKEPAAKLHYLQSRNCIQQESANLSRFQSWNLPSSRTCEAQNPQLFRLGVAGLKPILPHPDSYSLQTINNLTHSFGCPGQRYTIEYLIILGVTLSSGFMQIFLKNRKLWFSIVPMKKKNKISLKKLW